MACHQFYTTPWSINYEFKLSHFRSDDGRNGFQPVLPQTSQLRVRLQEYSKDFLESNMTKKH